MWLLLLRSALLTYLGLQSSHCSLQSAEIATQSMLFFIFFELAFYRTGPGSLVSSHRPTLLTECAHADITAMLSTDLVPTQIE
jgi:hypothetical protein